MASYKQISKYNWQVVVSLGYDEDGKKRRIKKQGFKNKKEAEIFVTETQNKRNKGYIAPNNNNILFKDFILQWFNDFKSNTLGISTKNSYNSRINYHILPKLGNYKLTSISTLIVQNFYNDLINEKKLSPASAKKIMDLLSNCFKYAKKNKLIYEVPTDIEKLKIDKPSIEYWHKEEVDYFLNEIKSSYLYTPILIDILTGLRVGELCGLKWQDIDLENGYINVNSQIIFDRETKQLVYTSLLKTETSERRISIPSLLINHLKSISDSEKPLKSDFVVKNRNGLISNPRNLSMDFTKRIAKYEKSIEEREACGNDTTNYMQLKRITFHGLRHTHATLLILNGENIKVVSDRLGHKDINTTLNDYTHVMNEMKQNTSTLLENMFKDLTTS